MEQFTCVRRSDHRCHDSCSLPCDGLYPCGHYVLLQAFRAVEPELVHCDVQQERYGERQVRYDAQRASACDGQHRSEGHDGCFRPCR